MAIKKITIPNSELRPVDGDNQYLVRFRVISDDRNRFSDWSQIFSINGTGIPSLASARVASFSAGSTVNIVWEGLPAGSEFDIFVGYDGDTPSYHGTTLESRYIFILSEQAETYRFAIQIASISKEYRESLQIFESDLVDVV